MRLEYFARSVQYNRKEDKKEMPNYYFSSKRVTEFEDIIEADTQDEAVKIFDELMADDMKIVSQHFEYDVYGLEVE